MAYRFQVQASKSITTTSGDIAKLVGVQGFVDLFVLDEQSRTDWNIRTNNYITPPSGKSSPTGRARFSFRNPGYVAAMLGQYHEMGINFIRTGVDPAMFNTVPYVDPNDGRTYPSELEMLDTIIDVASRYGMLINLTSACSFAPVSVNEAFLAALAAHYKNDGHVAICPMNEINCGNNSGQCANQTLWASTMTTYINAIRNTGNLNLIIINTPGQASGNPAAGFSVGSALPALNSAPFSTDPNLCIGIHHYRYPGSGVTSFGTAQAAVEDVEWGNYLDTYPILIEECGISPDVLNVYDPDMDGGTSVGLTEWGYAQAEHQGFLQYCKTKMETGNLNGVCVLGDMLWYPPRHLDLSLRRVDASWTTAGNIFRNVLLDAPIAPPQPQWVTIFNQTPPNTGGQDINGWNMRVLIPSSIFTANYTRMRLTLKPSATKALTFSTMYLGQQAATGDAYDAASFTQVKYQGANNISMPANTGPYLLDEIIISGTSGKNMIFSVGCGGTTWSSYSNSTGFKAMYKSSSSGSAGTANVTGYTVDDSVCPYISKIEVLV